MTLTALLRLCQPLPQVRVLAAQALQRPAVVRLGLFVVGHQRLQPRLQTPLILLCLAHGAVRGIDLRARMAPQADLLRLQLRLVVGRLRAEVPRGLLRLPLQRLPHGLLLQAQLPALLGELLGEPGLRSLAAVECLPRLLQQEPLAAQPAVQRGGLLHHAVEVLLMTFAFGLDDLVVAVDMVLVLLDRRVPRDLKLRDGALVVPVLTSQVLELAAHADEFAVALPRLALEVLAHGLVLLQHPRDSLNLQAHV
mmetsp:Transcript_74390/g.229864  ORF Transcript_74390/g.229864 Transcript_74390/m.229864 type:complete len:252 (-) Transcript_74390:550-1305(-)